MNAYRTDSRIEPNILVRVADPKTAVVLRKSDVRPAGWYVRWPNGLITTEDEETLIRVDALTKGDSR